MSIISSEPSNFEAALHYAGLNYKVFPVHGFLNGGCTCCKSPCPQGSKPGKHPACTHGYKDATVDQGRITIWFQGQPWLNVGIALGEDQVGVDVDPRHGGMATLEAWEKEHGALPKTPKVLTGSKGFHLYFKLPVGVVVKSKAGWAPGIDTRSLGGYLLAPPSLHECGQRYEWLVPLDEPLAMAPDWLLEVVADKPVSTPRTPSRGLSFGLVKDDGPCDFSTHPGAPEGQRHQELLRLTGIHLSRGDSMASIEAMAVRWGSRCSPPCEPKGLLQKIRGLAKADPSKRDSKREREMEIGAGMQEGKESISLAPAFEFHSLPFPDSPTQNGELKPEAGGEAPNPQSLSPIPSTPEPEHGLCLMKKDFANEPTPGLPEGGRGDYAYSQKPQAKSRGLSFGLVAQEESEGPGDGAQEFEPIDIVQGSRSRSKSLLSLRDSGGSAERPHKPAFELVPEPEAENFTYTVDTASVEAPDDWPELAPEAYHGLMGQIVQAVAPESEADPVGILLSLLVATGNAIGRKPHFAAGADSHHSNLFTAIVGNTASRKGMGWGVAKWLMQKAEAEWYSKHMGHGLGSGEGLIQRVADDEVVADGQGLFEFHVPEAKRLMDIEAEFVKLLETKGREGNTLNAMIRNAWDGSPLETMIVQRSGEKSKQKPRSKATNHHISILGHITPKELRKAMGGSVDMSNGFANRFLWALVRRARYLPDGGNIEVLEPFVEPLRTALEKAKGIGRVVRNDEARSLWHEVYKGLSESDEDTSGRAEAQTLRLSLIYAILDGSDTVRREHLEAALAVWRYCQHSAGLIFKHSVQEGTDRGREERDEPLDFKLLMMIEKTPGVKRTELVQAIPSRKRGLVGEALAGLQAKGLAHKLHVQAEGGGRTAESWFPGPNPDGPDDGEGIIPLADAGEFGEGNETNSPDHGPSFIPDFHSQEGNESHSLIHEFHSLPFPNFQGFTRDENPMPEFHSLPNIPGTQVDSTVDIMSTHEPTVTISVTYEPKAPEPQHEAKLPTNPSLPILSEQEVEVQAESVAMSEAEFFHELQVQGGEIPQPTLQAEAHNPKEFEREMNAIEPCGIDLPIARPKVKLVEPLPKPQPPTNGADYGLGQRVRTRLTHEPLVVVDVTIYGPKAQYYMLSHEDPQWKPPENLSVNTNFDRPRIIASMDDIVEVL